MRSPSSLWLALLLAGDLGCTTPAPPSPAVAHADGPPAPSSTVVGTAPASTAAPAAPSPAASSDAGASCGGGRELVVRFYDVGQGLAALVELPDGRKVLVDTGDAPSRAGCGEACARSSAHLGEMLARDLKGAPLDLVWITHQHSDHVGGVQAVLARVPARAYVDNGRELERAEIKHARAAAAKAGAELVTVDPEHVHVPLANGPELSLKAIVPHAWPHRCRSDQNDCSIMLRIDWCASSVLFTGDAEEALEKVEEPHGRVTLLQVGHHGSNTSSSEAFLTKVAPRYAVISAGKPHEGLNGGYCHPRASAVRRISRHLVSAVDGPGMNGVLRAYDRDDRCDDADLAAWVDVPTSARVFATPRDGDVTLATAGDGTFTRR